MERIYRRDARRKGLTGEKYFRYRMTYLTSLLDAPRFSDFHCTATYLGVQSKITYKNPHPVKLIRFKPTTKIDRWKPDGTKYLSKKLVISFANFRSASLVADGLYDIRGFYFEFQENNFRIKLLTIEPHYIDMCDEHFKGVCDFRRNDGRCQYYIRYGKSQCPEKPEITWEQDDPIWDELDEF